jgi:hypothetical protein
VIRRGRHSKTLNRITLKNDDKAKFEMSGEDKNITMI